jgi:hypothetical protein
MDIETYIRDGFPEGLLYNEAAQLCLRLYCQVDGIPEELHKECSKDGLAEAFASLAAGGFLRDQPLSAALYGANFHRVGEKGHWIEIIASLLKKGNTRDMELGEAIASRLTRRSIGRQKG